MKLYILAYDQVGFQNLSFWREVTDDEQADCLGYGSLEEAVRATEKVVPPDSFWVLDEDDLEALRSDVAALLPGPVDAESVDAESIATLQRVKRQLEGSNEVLGACCVVLPELLALSRVAIDIVQYAAENTIDDCPSIAIPTEKLIALEMVIRRLQGLDTPELVRALTALERIKP